MQLNVHVPRDRERLLGRLHFDVALVAQMLGHGIHAICTCNARDFGVAGIRAVEPAQALAVAA